MAPLYYNKEFFARKVKYYNLEPIGTMHGQQIYFSDQNLNGDQQMAVEGTNTHFQYHFKAFIATFSKQNVRIYHKQIQNMVHQGKYHFNLELADLKAVEEQLYEKLISQPIEILKVMEDALKDYMRERSEQFSGYNENAEWQAIITSNQHARIFRNIQSKSVSKLFVINGIIISCTKPFIKASRLKIKCKNCELTRIIKLQPGEYPSVPTYCPGQNGINRKCPQDPYVALPSSDVIDTQMLKIQQNPQQIPPGQIAKTYPLIVDRYNVGRCVPGDRVRITGIHLVHDLNTQNLSKVQIYVTGIQKIKERSTFHYTQQEQQIFKKMSKDPKIYEKIYKSIAPGICGNEQIKKAIACMLFGGSRKHLPDQTILRGDINILLIGDPSTAKSQFLKFVEQAASIAVYTSGKGSSAAGLTASITKDNNTGQFQIQGGALVLADGGIVCIDQFDKMKSNDRVAIHQAMEQQTISVAKAGITTRLNSRTSIFAAANPIYGSYRDMQQASDQIQLQTTILSRFDCIFIVRDINTNEVNTMIADHVLNLHQNIITKDSEDSDFPFELLKKYIKYAKSKIMPRLSQIASEKLQNIYVADRQKSKQQKILANNSIPITVRQLQAIIRLSESIAKMKLKSEVTADDVDQAHYLFEISTMKTIEGKQFGGQVSANTSVEVQKIQEIIKKKVCVGNQVIVSRLTDELEKYPSSLVTQAIHTLVKVGDFREIKAKKCLIRDR